MNFSHFKNENLYSDIDTNKAFNALSEIIKCKTISYIDDSKIDVKEFQKLHKILNDYFPLVTRESSIEVINECSLLYNIKGTDESLPAVLLMAHLDVVPDIINKENEWDFPAFSGQITDEYIYGRGSEDIKCMVILYLSAIEYLLSKNYKFKRSIYLAFGHDEETLGGKGQLQIKNLLQSRNVKMEVVLDEGGGIGSGSSYKVDNYLATINVMEKGYLDLMISSTSEGGHSSNPGIHTALGRVAKAVTLLEENQFKPYLNKVVRRSFEILHPFIKDETLKLYCSDIDKYKEQLINYCCNDKALAPLVYTTTAATMISSDSNGANVLPKKVEAIINFRLLDCDDVIKCEDHIKKLITDKNIDIKLLNSINASSISDINSKGYKTLEKMINYFYDDVLVIPSMICGGTDCGFYNEMTNYCYRFNPIFNDLEKCNNVHNVNERCQKRAFVHGIKFIIKFIEEMCI